MRRLSRLATTFALAAAACAMPLATTATAAPAAAAAASPTPTNFGLLATGYGAKVNVAGMVTSENVGWTSLACTNKAGLTKSNGVATVNVPKLGTINGVSTRTWTTKSGSRVNSFSTHDIAGIDLVDAGLFDLSISAIHAESRAWWDGSRFRASTKVNVGGLTLGLNGQPAKTIPLPAPGQTIDLGPLKIGLGAKVNTVKASMARATARGLTIIIDDGQGAQTRVVVARTVAQIEKGITAGVFRGYAAGLRGQILPLGGKEGDPLVELGRTPLRNMPCVGTKDQVKFASVATVGVPGLGSVGGLSAQVKGGQDNSRAKGNAIAQVASVSLLNGRVKVTGIKAQANVTRWRSGRLIRNAQGSKFVSITVDGKSYDIPSDKTVNIADLVNIDPVVTRRTDNGIEVVGVRIKLLDGTGAVIDLAVAKLEIKRYWG